MSHTYEDRETGVRFHYNSDLSGDIAITCPGKETLDVPAEALSRFLSLVVLDSEEIVEWLDKVKEWINRHSYAGAGEDEVPTLVRPQPQRCETCEDAPDDCYPDPPGSGGCDSHKPKVRPE